LKSQKKSMRWANFLCEYINSGKTCTTIITSCAKLGRRGWNVALEVFDSFRAELTTMQAVADCLAITSECLHSSEASTASSATLHPQAASTAQGGAAAVSTDPATSPAEDELARRYRSVPSRGALEALAICYGAAIGVCRSSGAGSWRAAAGLLDQMRADGLSQRMLAAFPHVRKGFGTNMHCTVIGVCASAGEWRQVRVRRTGVSGFHSLP
jgi:hypothetical protein